MMSSNDGPPASEQTDGRGLHWIQFHDPLHTLLCHAVYRSSSPIPPNAEFADDLSFLLIEDVRCDLGFPMILREVIFSYILNTTMADRVRQSGTVTEWYRQTYGKSFD